MAKTIMRLEINLDRSLAELGLDGDDKEMLVNETALFFKQLAELIAYKKTRAKEPPAFLFLPHQNTLQ